MFLLVTALLFADTVDGEVFLFVIGLAVTWFLVRHVIALNAPILGALPRAPHGDRGRASSVAPTANFAVKDLLHSWFTERAVPNIEMEGAPPPLATELPTEAVEFTCDESRHAQPAQGWVEFPGGEGVAVSLCLPDDWSRLAAVGSNAIVMDADGALWQPYELKVIGSERLDVARFLEEEKIAVFAFHPLGRHPSALRWVFA